MTRKATSIEQNTNTSVETELSVRKRINFDEEDSDEDLLDSILAIHLHDCSQRRFLFRRKKYRNGKPEEISLEDLDDGPDA